MILVRDARVEDADAGSTVLRRSIIELRVADHRNDPALLDQWLRNKTPEHFRAWLARPDHALLVALREGDVVGVGSVSDTGYIGLNYVSPAARLAGVSAAMLVALEQRAIANGANRCHLTSTTTARRFYLARGYQEGDAPPEQIGVLRGYPMSKAFG